MMVGLFGRNRSSLASLRKKIASWDALDGAMISLSATLSAIKGVLVMRHEMGPLLHMNNHALDLVRWDPSCTLTSAKLASLQP
jgi:hypothetical protein